MNATWFSNPLAAFIRWKFFNHQSAHLKGS